MADVMRQRFQNIMPWPQLRLRLKRDVLKEIDEPCSRYRPLTSFNEKVRRQIADTIDPLDPVSRDALVLSDGVPLNWRKLLLYLYEEKIIATTRFRLRDYRNDLPPRYALNLTPNIEKDLADGRDVVYRGFASTSNIEECISKAIGETLERHLLTLYKSGNLLKSSYADLLRRKVPALPIENLNGYLDWQKEKFPLLGAGHDTQLFWVEGKRVDTGARTLLPAQLVYWSYRIAEEEGEKALAHTTTNGCAGHFSYEEALLASLLESIQRDGFFMYWLNTISPPIVDVENIDDARVRDLLETFKRYRLRVYFLNITSDIGIPTLACAIVDDSGTRQCVSVAAANGAPMVDMILHSADEALAIFNYTRSEVPHILSQEYEAFSDPSILRKHRLLAWQGKEMLDRFAFFISGEHQSSEEFMRGALEGNPAEQLKELRQRLAQKGPGYEVYAFEVRHRVLDTLGYHVVRAIVPQLFPLYLDETQATLDSRRLREVPLTLGYKVTGPLNPWPHPFP